MSVRPTPPTPVRPNSIAAVEDRARKLLDRVREVRHELAQCSHEIEDGQERLRALAEQEVAEGLDLTDEMARQEARVAKAQAQVERLRAREIAAHRACREALQEVTRQEVEADKAFKAKFREYHAQCRDYLESERRRTQDQTERTNALAVEFQQICQLVQGGVVDVPGAVTAGQFARPLEDELDRPPARLVFRDVSGNRITS